MIVNAKNLVSDLLDPPASDGPLILAVPSKGRLQENASAFFARAGLDLVQSRGAREYRGAIAGLPGVEVLFLSASEIVAQLASGAAHLGITGEDLVREKIADADSAVELLTPLGFGHANVVVAVPQAWIDVTTMADLDDVAAHMRAKGGERLRVATKYMNLTRRFFAGHGLADYRIVESLGATEGAPASGSAEAIVDITTTGATLAANALKILSDGIILRSEANLVASVRAPWSATAREAAAIILTRIAAEEEARTTREVTARIEGIPYEKITEFEQLFQASKPYGQSAFDPTLVLQCPSGRAFDLAQALMQAGATAVSVRKVDYLFRPSNVLHERLMARIG